LATVIAERFLMYAILRYFRSMDNKGGSMGSLDSGVDSPQREVNRGTQAGILATCVTG
jgi:hypothetical protein